MLSKKLNVGKVWKMSVLVISGLLISVPSWSVPQTPERVTDDTEIYQNLSEIRSPKKREMLFREDLHRLIAIESRFHERLPNPRGYDKHQRVSSPIKKIKSKKYIYRGSKKSRKSRF